MTYDSTEILSNFHAENSLMYPLLRDVGAQHVTALGIRNEDYAQGHMAYGIPHPGILFIAPDGTVQAKIAVPGYRNRPPFDALLEHIKSLTN